VAVKKTIDMPLMLVPILMSMPDDTLVAAAAKAVVAAPIFVLIVAGCVTKKYKGGRRGWKKSGYGFLYRFIKTSGCE